MVMGKRQWAGIGIATILFVAARSLPPKALFAQEFRFTEAFLTAEENILLGKKRFLQRCTYCHAKTGVSGKGPQLRPSKRDPEFIFNRITNGYEGMPAWKTILSDEDRRAIVAYIRSDTEIY